MKHNQHTIQQLSNDTGPATIGVTDYWNQFKFLKIHRIIKPRYNYTPEEIKTLLETKSP